MGMVTSTVWTLSSREKSRQYTLPSRLGGRLSLSELSGEQINISSLSGIESRLLVVQPVA